MTNTVAELIQSAEALVNQGQWQAAAALWKKLHALDARHPKALFGLGLDALRQGDRIKARDYLERTLAVSPKDLLAWMTLATIQRELGAALPELQALSSALAVDPYCLPALLLKAGWYERQGYAADAVATYQHCLQIAPRPSSWPAYLKAQLDHAHALVQRHNERLSQYLSETLATEFNALDANETPRWYEAASILAGHSKPYHSQANQLQVPRLPPLPFHSREAFPWLAALERHTDTVREELLTLLNSTREGFTPYIAYQPGQPVNQWANLNHSDKWSALHLWRSGTEITENLQRCPRTAALLRELQLVQIDGLCPNVMFSVLAPHTHIPPHHGETNARLVAHLPLIVPPHCMLRVGYEQRGWKVGETLIFDDTIEHEARNDSDELRAVLIFDLWNPLLSAAERRMVQAMTAARRAFAG